MKRYQLICVGEIKFGPAFYELYIDNKKIKNRIFGSISYETQSKEYFVFQEWLNIKYNRGPITRPFIINMVDQTYCEVTDGKKGFTENFVLESDVLKYDQINMATKIIEKNKINLNTLNFISLNKLTRT